MTLIIYLLYSFSETPAVHYISQGCLGSSCIILQFSVSVSLFSTSWAISLATSQSFLSFVFSFRSYVFTV